MPSVKPRELEDLIARRLADDREFRAWLLSRTKFAKLWPFARMLTETSAAAAEGELAVGFELERTKLRFSLVIAIAMGEADLERIGVGASPSNVMDFETVLLAPQSLILDTRTLCFDRRIPFESVAGFLPEFAVTGRIAA